MTATARLLDTAREKLSLTSDNQLAHYLDWGQSSVSGYRRGRNVMDSVRCREFSEKTGIDLKVVVDAAADDKIASTTKTRIKYRKAA